MRRKLNCFIWIFIFSVFFGLLLCQEKSSADDCIIIMYGKHQMKITTACDTMHIGERAEIDIEEGWIKKKSKIRFRSKNPEIAMVNQKGIITALSKGKTVITMSIKTGKQKRNIKAPIRVKERSQIASGLSDEDFELSEKLKELETQYPSGLYWNHVGTGFDAESEENMDMVTAYPCPDHSDYTQTCNRWLIDISTAEGVENPISFYSWGYQCSGYAFMISDKLFEGQDKAITSYYTDVEQIRIGDYIRYNNDTHSAIVTGVFDDYIVVTDCNGAGEENPCMILWGKEVKKSKLIATNFYGLSRRF